MNEAILTMGIDVGGSYLKGVILEYSNSPKLVDKKVEKIRKRNPADVATEMIDYLV